MGDHTAKTPAEDRQAWRQKVRRYIRAGDRGVEPCYVGREDLLHITGEMVARATDGQRDSRTLVVSGGPGAGKSAYLREVERLWKDKAVVVEVLADEMTPGEVFAKVAKAAGVPVKEQRERRAEAKGGVNAGFARLGGRLADTTRRPADSELAARGRVMPWELMRERLKVLGMGKGRKPLILVCDEAQTLDQEDKATTGMLRSLHRGDLDADNPIPVIPIFAGLANTEEVMGDCGISRDTGGNFVPLGRLTEAQSREYALKILAHLDADGSQGEMARWVEWAEEHSDGWPMHLRDQMNAVAEEMLRLDTSRLRDLDGERIARVATKARDDHYGRRLTATRAKLLRPLYHLLARAASEGEGAPIAELVDRAEKYGEEQGKPVGGEDVLDRLVRAGVLQPVSAAKPDVYHCPIPSLADWLGGNAHVIPMPPTHGRDQRHGPVGKRSAAPAHGQP